MSYNYYYSSYCSSSARNCVSGCCTYSGSCATTSSTCSYPYSDYYINSYYYFPGGGSNGYSSTTTTTSSSSVSPYIVSSIIIPISISLGYILLALIGIWICHCKRKATVEAINNMATHRWLDGQLVLICNNLNQPAYGVKIPPNQHLVNSTYLNSAQQRARFTPNKSHILQVNNSDMNISMDRLVLNRVKDTLPPIQQNSIAQVAVNDFNPKQQIQEVQIFQEEEMRPAPQLNQTQSIQLPIQQQIVQQQIQQPIQQTYPQIKQNQRPMYPMPSSSFGFLGQSLNVTFNRLFQNNVPPARLISYQPLVD